MNIRAWSVALSMVAVLSLGVSQPLFDLFSRHPEFFVARQMTTLDVVAFIAAVGLGLPMLGALVVLAVRRIPRIGVAAGMVLLLGGFLLLGGYGVRQSIALSGMSGIAAPLAAGVMAWACFLRFAALRSGLEVLGMLALPAVPLLFALQPQIRPLINPNAGAAFEPMPIDTPVPVTILVLDELSLVSLLDEDLLINERLYPHFARLARESYWFRNATATTDATVRAIPVLLTGLLDPVTVSAPVADRYPVNLFSLLADRYRMNVTEQVTRMCPPKICEAPVEPGLWDALRLANDLVVVFGHLALPPDLAGRLPDVSTRWEGFGDAGLMAETFPEGWQKFAQEKLDTVDRERVYRDWLAAIEAGDDPQLNFLHILLPHVPYEFTEDGQRYQPTKLVGVRSNDWMDESAAIDAERRYLMQAQHVDQMVGDLIQRLESTGMYERSVLVVLSDHGVAFNMESKRRKMSEPNVGDILPIPLFVRVPGQTQGVISDRNVETLDLLPTILDALDARNSPALDGQSMLSDQPARPGKLAYTEGVKWQLDGGRQWDPKRIRERHQRFGDGGRPRDLYTRGLDLEVPETEPPSPGIPGPFRVEIDQSDSGPIAGYLRRLTGRVKGENLPEQVALALYVDGELATTVRTYYVDKNWTHYFALMVPEELAHKGLDTFRFYQIDENAEDSGLRPLSLTRP